MELEATSHDLKDKALEVQETFDKDCDRAENSEVMMPLRNSDSQCERNDETPDPGDEEDEECDPSRCNSDEKPCSIPTCSAVKKSASFSTIEDLLQLQKAKTAVRGRKSCPGCYYVHRYITPPAHHVLLQEQNASPSSEDTPPLSSEVQRIIREQMALMVRTALSS